MKLARGTAGFVLGLVLGVSGTAIAQSTWYGFFNGNAYMQQGELQQAMYLAGVNDAFTMPMWRLTRFHECAQKWNMPGVTVWQMKTIGDQYLAQHPADWNNHMADLYGWALCGASGQ